MKITMTTEKVVVLTELERKRRSVAQLRRKLESYLYEPQTHKGFERKQTLKTTIDLTAHKTDSLLAILKKNEICIHENKDSLERHIEECHNLEQRIALYFSNR